MTVDHKGMRGLQGNKAHFDESQYMVQAVKFCLAKGLMTEEEAAPSKDMEKEKRKCAEAIVRMRLWKERHPEKS